jgi:hypothetical protein
MTAEHLGVQWTAVAMETARSKQVDALATASSVERLVIFLIGKLT